MARQFESLSDLFKVVSGYYGRGFEAETFSWWVDDLEHYPVAAVQEACRIHREDAQHGKFMPRSGDLSGIVKRYLESVKPKHLGANEAFALAHHAASEGATVVWTDQIRSAWFACAGLYATDEVGGRMAFKEAYTRAVDMATGEPQWKVSMGTDAEARAVVIGNSIRLGYLPPTYSHPFLEASGSNVLMLPRSAGMAEVAVAVAANSDDCPQKAAFFTMYGSGSDWRKEARS